MSLKDFRQFAVVQSVKCKKEKQSCGKLRDDFEIFQQRIVDTSFARL